MTRQSFKQQPVAKIQLGRAETWQTLPKYAKVEFLRFLFTRVPLARQRIFGGAQKFHRILSAICITISNSFCAARSAKVNSVRVLSSLVFGEGLTTLARRHRVMELHLHLQRENECNQGA